MVFVLQGKKLLFLTKLMLNAVDLKTKKNDSLIIKLSLNISSL